MCFFLRCFQTPSKLSNGVFNENGSLASDPAIKTTPKSIGFSSQTRDIHYYSEDPEREDFYVPRSIEVNLLKNLEKKEKALFSEFDGSQGYCNILCK